MSDEKATPLFQLSRETYGDRYDDHLLELYKVLVGSAERISERRTSANNFLLAVNTSLITLYGFGKAVGTKAELHVGLPLAGVLVCVAWFGIIRSYRNVNEAKFKVIHELETKLPARPYDREWDLMKKSHVPLSILEQWVPAIFAVLYGAVGWW